MRGRSVDQALGSVPGASEPIRDIRPVFVPAQFFVWGTIFAGGLGLLTSVGILGLLDLFTTLDFGNNFVSLLAFGLAFGLAFAVILGLIGLYMFYEPALSSGFALSPRPYEHVRS
jgi:hypothetical protein